MKKSVPLAILLVVVHLAIIPVVDAEHSAETRTDLDPVYDPAYKGTTYWDLGGPFLIQVNDSFFRQTASYPRGETMADGMFLFVDIKIFNNSHRTLQIPRFTLQDPRGRTYPTAIRAMRSNKAIWQVSRSTPESPKMDISSLMFRPSPGLIHFRCSTSC